ncbi:CerR family C-terminal domain-containing protein [Fundidesulfovibrio terrae]|uniref:CerR family C-terminal domain-containing protein n=1 Tax=Fundidesulfovibrio terrae TaxID=2922866 RepID=UPI001FAF642D|nr:CerR family C-terminal domain-containing protein [Fundidesulfovibrio terrae]
MPLSQPDQQDRRLERGQRTRGRLVEAGLKLFALKGFEAVSIRELAAEGEANAAAISFHFGGKAGLYAAVVDHVTAHLAGVYRQALEPAASLTGDVPPDEAASAVRAMVARLIEALLTTPRSRWTSLLLQREFIDPTRAFERIFSQALEPALDAFARAVEAAGGATRGSLDNKALAFGIFVLASAYSRSRATFLKWSGRLEYAPGDTRELGRIVSDFVLGGLAGSTRPGTPHTL